ncbi:hypothetical protein Q4519_16005 [Motilimonas sp. 1_MG-2023]|uniref:hypothetical protein n=1 Tax=Motilimonas sp. 1_MG-2023 TaxID=3062672 RepID=UPI0026E365E6|nr:hypothetical protein [Motilimonas sp. 1_MG-2023]MDO6527184.1 hypothetical protein [Motilimonas sp. 1_MG-2023]
MNQYCRLGQAIMLPDETKLSTTLTTFVLTVPIKQCWLAVDSCRTILELAHSSTAFPLSYCAHP